MAITVRYHFDETVGLLEKLETLAPYYITPWFAWLAYVIYRNKKDVANQRIQLIGGSASERWSETLENIDNQKGDIENELDTYSQRRLRLCNHRVECSDYQFERKSQETWKKWQKPSTEIKKISNQRIDLTVNPPRDPVEVPATEGHT